MENLKEKKIYKTIFISDLHIGSSHCKSDVLLEFLKEYSAPTIYLVGDIFDFWKLKKKFFIPKKQIAVVKRLLKLAKKGVKIKYVIGNHDEALRPFLRYNLEIENIEISNTFIHKTVSGKSFLVLHGDQFDGFISPWLYHLGDFVYEILLELNTQLNWFRHKIGIGYWSLSKFLKTKTKESIAFINNFDLAVATYCKKRKCDGIIYGHTHSPNIRQILDMAVMNTGDFVDGCSAIVEDFEGNFILLEYKENSWIETAILNFDNKLVNT